MSKLMRYDRSVASPITNFNSEGAAAVHLGSGSGENHTYVIHFEPGGQIGEHVTGFGQLFIVIDGSGWMRIEGRRYEVSAGETIAVPRGVSHAKGSEVGMIAVMVQSFDLDLAPR